MIANLSEEKFNKLVVEFNKEYWETKEVFITNGPYDGGIDLVVRVDGSEIRKSIQVTVQKTNIERKVLEDAAKAERNVVDYAYLSVLELYLSQSLSKSVQNRLVRDAKIKYSIDLKIISSTELAYYADENPVIGRFLREIYIPFASSFEQLKVDKQTKVLYDIIALGADTTKIKHQFIQSLILYYIYDNGPCADDVIHANLNVQLGIAYNKSVYRNNLFELKSKGSVIVSDDKKVFSLSDTAKNSLEQASQIVAVQEQNLFQEVESILKKYSMSKYAGELVEKVLNLFEENYSVDLKEEEAEEIESVNENIRGIYRDILAFIEGKKLNINSKKAALELLTACGDNPLLNKISVSKLFINLNRSNKLEAYLKAKSRKVVLNTQVLFQFICSSYKSVPYENIWYKSVRDLSKIWSGSPDKYVLITTDGYVREVANHVLDAYNIDNFLHGFLEKEVGTSNNAFYSYYVFLRENNFGDFERFSEFVEDAFDLNLDDHKRNLIVEMIKHIQNMLEYMGVQVISMVDYNEKLKADLKKAYEEELLRSYRNKSYYALLRDVDAILYLSTSDNHLDSTGQISEPIFVTWDASIQSIRPVVDKVYAAANYWYLYTPAKLLDRLSVMKFSLNPKSVTSNIIALTESNYNASSKMSNNFVDTLQSLSGNQKLSSWTLGKKLTQMRKKQLESEVIEDSTSPYKNPPIDIILLEISKYYKSNKSSHGFSDLVATFGDIEVQNDVLNIVNKYADKYKPGDYVGKDLFAEIDVVIAQSKKSDE